MDKIKSYMRMMLLKKAVKESDVANFYALSLLAPLSEAGNIEYNSKIIQARNKVVWDIAKYYINNMHKAIISELMQGQARYWPENQNNIKVLENAGIKKNFTESDIRQFNAKQYEILFLYMNWAGAYGGKPWAEIANLYGQLLKLTNELRDVGSYSHQALRALNDGTLSRQMMELTSIIDRVHQLEHNTGSLFTYFNDGEYHWINKMLTNKSLQSSLQILRDKVEPINFNKNDNLDLKPLIQSYHNKPDRSKDELDEEIGEVEAARQIARKRKNIEKTFHNHMSYLNDSYAKNHVDEIRFNREKKELLTQFNESMAGLNYLPNIIELIANNSAFGSDAVTGYITSLLKQNLPTEDILKVIATSMNYISVKLFNNLIHINDPIILENLAAVVIKGKLPIIKENDKELFDGLYTLFPMIMELYSRNDLYKNRFFNIKKIYFSLLNNGYKLDEKYKPIFGNTIPLPSPEEITTIFNNVVQSLKPPATNIKNDIKKSTKIRQTLSQILKQLV